MPEEFPLVRDSRPRSLNLIDGRRSPWPGEEETTALGAVQPGQTSRCPQINGRLFPLHRGRVGHGGGAGRRVNSRRERSSNPRTWRP